MNLDIITDAYGYVAEGKWVVWILDMNKKEWGIIADGESPLEFDSKEDVLTYVREHEDLKFCDPGGNDHLSGGVRVRPAPETIHHPDFHFKEIEKIELDEVLKETISLNPFAILELDFEEVELSELSKAAKLAVYSLDFPHDKASLWTKMLGRNELKKAILTLQGDKEFRENIRKLFTGKSFWSEKAAMTVFLPPEGFRD